jgi:hypothetical protein
VEIDVGSAEDYIPKADAKICRIKERYHSIMSGLPFTMESSTGNDQGPSSLYCIKDQHRKIHSNQPERDAEGAFHVCGFSEEVWVGIWLLYAAGSWAYMNLLTKQRIRRLQWLKTVRTEVITS